jgi:hypothetical protein
MAGAIKMLKVFIVYITLMVSWTIGSSAYAQNPEYLLVKGELACQEFSSDQYQCLDLKAREGAASYTLILTTAELLHLSAVPGTIAKENQNEIN